MEIKDIFSSRLRKLRTAKGKEYTRQRVADDLSISRASLEYYEKGQRLPDIEIAAKIADYYNVSVDYLLGRAKNKTTIQEKNDLCKYIRISEKAADSILELLATYDDETELLQKNVTPPYEYDGFSEEHKEIFDTLRNANKAYNYYFDLCCKSGIIMKLCDFLSICNKYITYYADSTRFGDDFIKMKYYNLFMLMWDCIPEIVEDMYWDDLEKGKAILRNQKDNVSDDEIARYKFTYKAGD